MAAKFSSTAEIQIHDANLIEILDRIDASIKGMDKVAKVERKGVRRARREHTCREVDLWKRDFKCCCIFLHPDAACFDHTSNLAIISPQGRSFHFFFYRAHTRWAHALVIDLSQTHGSAFHSLLL
jgi:hypothetical protein